MERWVKDHPLLAPLSGEFGFDHVYTTPWFAALLFVFLFSLVLSTIEQIKTSIKKTFGHGVLSGGRNLKVDAPADKIKTAITRLGYFRVAGKEGVSRFVKHPWGYWGNVLLHLGIMLLIASSLIVVLFEKRGLLNVENNGIFSGRFILPEAVMLDRVSPEFWGSDSLKDLKTTISFSDPQGKTKRYELGINHTVDFMGLRVYQDHNFGHAFFITLTEREGIRPAMAIFSPRGFRTLLKLNILLIQRKKAW